MYSTLHCFHFKTKEKKGGGRGELNEPHTQSGDFSGNSSQNSKLTTNKKRNNSDYLVLSISISHHGCTSLFIAFTSKNKTKMRGNGEGK